MLLLRFWWKRAFNGNEMVIDRQHMFSFVPLNSITHQSAVTLLNHHCDQRRTATALPPCSPSSKSNKQRIQHWNMQIADTVRPESNQIRPYITWRLVPSDGRWCGKGERKWGGHCETNYCEYAVQKTRKKCTAFWVVINDPFIHLTIDRLSGLFWSVDCEKRKWNATIISINWYYEPFFRLFNSQTGSQQPRSDGNTRTGNSFPKRNNGQKVAKELFFAGQLVLC